VKWLVDRKCCAAPVEGGELLVQRITRTAKNPVRMRRAIVVVMSGRGRAVVGHGHALAPGRPPDQLVPRELRRPVSRSLREQRGQEDRSGPVGR
jgi:hypothetical protein